VIIKEACVDSLKGAIIAEKNGADRIELCSLPDQDGLSPSPELVESTCNHLKIPVMVMVRLRTGNFQYTNEEMDEMIRYVRQIRSFSISGFVFGALTSEYWPELDQTMQIVDAAGELDTTFHKAIDCTPDPVESAKRLNPTGISRILTSGGEETADNGSEVINAMQEASNQKILAAGKITSDNLPFLQKKLNVTEFHGKRIVGDLYSAL